MMLVNQPFSFLSPPICRPGGMQDQGAGTKAGKLSMQDITRQTITTAHGVSLSALVAGREGDHVLVLVHGWPDLALGWRDQMQPLAAAGFRVCAIDVRGYGGSDCPEPVAAYAMTELMQDVVGVIDALGAEDAVLVGHDWGAPIVWHTALFHPERVRAVAGLSVPYFPRAGLPPLALWHRYYTDRDLFFYQVYFQDEGVAEAAFEADVAASLGKVLWSISGAAVEAGASWPQLPAGASMLENLSLPSDEQRPAWMSGTDFARRVESFERTGFRGSLNRYRNIDRDYHDWPDYGVRRVRQPSAFIAGALDAVRRFSPGHDVYATADILLDDCRGVTVIDGAGHWVQLEAPEAVNRALLDFLDSL